MASESTIQLTSQNIWAASSEFVTYRLCEQRRFRRACASAQSLQNLRCSLIQAVSQEEPSDRKPDPWPLWMAGYAQLKFVMTECSKIQIRLTRSICWIAQSTKTCGYSQSLRTNTTNISVWHLRYKEAEQLHVTLFSLHSILLSNHRAPIAPGDHKIKFRIRKVDRPTGLLTK